MECALQALVFNTESLTSVSKKLKGANRKSLSTDREGQKPKDWHLNQAWPVQSFLPMIEVDRLHVSTPYCAGRGLGGLSRHSFKSPIRHRESLAQSESETMNVTLGHIIPDKNSGQGEREEEVTAS